MKRYARVPLAMAVLFAAAALAMLPGLGQAQDDAGTDVLRIGWGQDPQTLNPFYGQDEESFNVWSMTWDLLVNFGADDLSTAPGIATDWKVSEDQLSVEFELDPDRVWSDGESITSEDVKWSLENLGSEGDIFAGYTDGITKIETPDDYTVILETKKPDARLLGGLFLYILPEHVWGKVDLDELTRTYQPKLPMVGSGPYIVTEFERGRIITMERNPEWQGSEPAFDEIQYVKYGSQDAVERALTLGELDMVVEVEESTFGRIAENDDIETLSSPNPSYTQLAFNLCPEELCPDAVFNPAVQELEVRQAIAYAVDRERINEIAAKGTAFVANGILPSYYKQFYTEPEQTYPFDPELANQILDDAGWVDNGEDPRTKDGMTLSFDLFVRSESNYNVQAARLVAEMADEIGVEFKVQAVSVDKLYDLTVRKIDGKPAPEFDSFIWGWGGDPYDPGYLLNLLTTKEIGSLSDAFYSNPEYDALYTQQSQTFDVEERKEIIAEMIEITQEDVAYLVLTWDPNLQAYRTDTLANVEPTCPAETGDLICEQTSYEPLLSIEPAEAGAGGDDGGRGGAFLALVGMAVASFIAYFVGLKRGRREAEPLELEE